MNFQMNSSLKNLQNACEYENLVSVVHRHQLFVKCVQKKLRNKVVKIYPPRLYMSQKTLVCLAKNVPKFLMLEVFRKVHQELTQDIKIVSYWKALIIFFQFEYNISLDFQNWLTLLSGTLFYYHKNMTWWSSVKHTVVIR